MADEELIRHLFTLLTVGPEAWNQWRKENPEVKVDFSGHKFEGILPAHLYDLNFAGADISNADFRSANLSRTNFSGAQGLSVMFWGATLDDANFTNALMRGDFRGAYIQRANFSGADLGGANFNQTEAAYANLSSANISEARFHGANLENVSFKKSHAGSANFTAALLDSADFTETILVSAIFSAASLNKTNFTNAQIGRTLFSELDLRSAVGLETLHHRAPSTIGVDTVILSEGKLPEVFLRGCGIPDAFSLQIPSLVRSLGPIQFYSCFISYSHQDKTFARRLHDALKQQGIYCWLDEHKMLPGDDIFEQVDQGIRVCDKILLCCSRGSLTSWWVDNEINTAFEKEQQLMKQRGHRVLTLIPLNLDGYMFSGEWESGKGTQIRSRFAVDFTGWQTDRNIFEQGVDRILLALRADSGGRESAPTPKL